MKSIKNFIKKIIGKIIIPCINEHLEHFLLNNNEINKIKKDNIFILECLGNFQKNPEESKLVSIIMPTYNRAFIIDQAIKSVLNQTYSNWELIIIDDGSTDNTHDIVKKYMNDKRIKYFLKCNEGVSSARNYGLKISKGSLISYLDTDNKYYPNFISSMVNSMINNPEKNCAYSGYIFHEKNGSHIIVHNEFNYKKLCDANFIDMNIFVHTKELYENLGGFDENLKRLVDWDLILKYTKDNEPLFVKTIGCEYYDGKWERISNSENHNDNFNRVRDKNYESH